VALAVLFFQATGLLTGGTTGLAFLIHYGSGWQIGGILFVINLPFYIFGYKAMGPTFTVKTFVAVGLLSAYVEMLPRWLEIQNVQPLFGAIIGGLLAGTGILILIRHGASLGGVTIMAIYLQKARHWRAGLVQMALDASILVCGIWLLQPGKVALSIVGAVALNMVIAVNHRTGRYFTV
jgi:uncharacterized membrane-anchored protein YitT (DUF2179 family)